MNESHAAVLREAPNVFPIFSTEGADEHTDSRRGDGVSKKVRDAMALLNGYDVVFGIAAMVTPENPTGSCLLSQHAPKVAALAAETGGFCTERKSTM